MELNFEFRTSEKNGILLSVSNPGSSPALSVELQNGAVVMTVDMGNGNISNVTNYIENFVPCHNKWHKVIALISSELTINVNGVSKSWVLSDSINEIEAPLYIGGIPGNRNGGEKNENSTSKVCVLQISLRPAPWKSKRTSKGAYETSKSATV